MYSITAGDLVKFLPKFYGPDTPDQWVDLVGIVLDVFEADPVCLKDI